MSHKIKVMKANPDMDSQDIARLINICREERRTVIDYYTVEQEREYIKNLHPRDAVFVARIDGVEFAGFAAVSRRWPYSKRLQHCGEVGTYVMPTFRRVKIDFYLSANIVRIIGIKIQSCTLLAK